MEDNALCHGVIGNIPEAFHSADLRAYFSQFIESEGFDCFHFRHRPEAREESNNRTKTTCCVVRLSNYKMAELIRMYNKENWTDKAGQTYGERAAISRIKIQNGEEDDGTLYQSKAEKKHKLRSTTEFLASDLKRLSELNPPPIMPNGNVGTPLIKYVELIRQCKFPPHLIKKLGLSFPRSRIKKYGNVPFDYGNEFEWEQEEPENQDGCSISNDSCSNDHSSLHCNTSEQSTFQDFRTSKLKINKAKLGEGSGEIRNSESDNESDHKDSDGELEEWDRHNTLHNDVDSQGRTKERLFEEEIELKWEKGGSGLVWYTDAAFWKQQEEADFDEETVDDWDVDMGIYEEEGGGDKDAKDLLQMRVEKQWKAGNDIDPNRVGGFERFTRGIGGSVMRQQGWTEGQSLGSSQLGITEPIPADGQGPSSKRGLGYHGKKLERHVKRPRATRDVVISTVFDKPENRSGELFESQGPHSIKYRDSVSFVPARYGGQTS